MHAALVFGGGGQLGRAIVSALRAAHYGVISVDYARNDDADVHVPLLADETAAAQLERVRAAVADAAARITDTALAAHHAQQHEQQRMLAAIISVAGGFRAGAVDAPDVCEPVEAMWKANVGSALVAAHVASRLLRPNGLLVLTGAAAGLGPTPGLIGYGMSKAAAHQLVASLSQDGVLPPGACVCALLPVMLDTPANRKAMPDADTSTWTPLEHIAARLVAWAGAESAAARPPTGSLLEVVTARGHTSFTRISLSVQRDDLPDWM